MEFHELPAFLRTVLPSGASPDRIIGTESALKYEYAYKNEYGLLCCIGMMGAVHLKRAYEIRKSHRHTGSF